MNRKWVGLAALLVVVLAGAMIAYNVLAPGVEKSGNTGDSVTAAVVTDVIGNAEAGNTAQTQTAAMRPPRRISRCTMRTATRWRCPTSKASRSW